MLWRLAFLLALAVHQVPAKYYPVTYVENLEVDQNDAALGSRIVSGWDAELGQHPHQAALRLMNAGGRIYNCGGSIVHKEWVITAAHCTANQLFILVRAGLIELWNPEAMVDTMEYYVYPTYSVTDPRVQVNDISLVRLPQPLVYSKNLHSIRIQSTMETYKDFNNELLYASGFGRTWTNGPIPTTLQWVYLRGVSNQRCASLFGTNVVNFNTICAGFYNVTSQSICHGDSGGPLVQLSPEGKPILVGVSSFVANVPHGCHSGIPGAFVRPGAFHWWFTSVTGIDFDNLNEDY